MKGRNLDYGHMYEGRMIRTELDNIERNAKQLHDILHDGDDLPEWVNKKIFLANSYLKSAKIIYIIKLFILNTQQIREKLEKEKKANA